MYILLLSIKAKLKQLWNICWHKHTQTVQNCVAGHKLRETNIFIFGYKNTFLVSLAHLCQILNSIEFECKVKPQKYVHKRSM